MEESISDKGGKYAGCRMIVTYSRIKKGAIIESMRKGGYDLFKSNVLEVVS